MAKKIIKRTKDGETLYFGTHTDAVLSEVRVGKESLTATLSAIITSLASYYTKSETYSQAEVNQLVSAIKQFNVVVAASLPTASASTMNTIYLIPSSHSEQGNVKDEFITIQDGGSYKWEQIGTTAIDLSGYSTTVEMNAAIASALSAYSTTSAMNAAIASAIESEEGRAKASVGYYICDTAASTAAKVVNAAGYVLHVGGNIRIKMTNANTAANVTLNINGTSAKALYYDGSQASATNTWEAGEVLEVYYDGTQYQASNAQGGGGKFATGQLVKETGIDETPTRDSMNLPMSKDVYSLREKVGFDLMFSFIAVQGKYSYVTLPIEVNKRYKITVTLDADAVQDETIIMSNSAADNGTGSSYSKVGVISSGSRSVSFVLDVTESNLARKKLKGKVWGSNYNVAVKYETYSTIQFDTGEEVGRVGITDEKETNDHLVLPSSSALNSVYVDVVRNSNIVVSLPSFVSKSGKYSNVGKIGMQVGYVYGITFELSQAFSVDVEFYASNGYNDNGWSTRHVRWATVRAGSTKGSGLLYYADNFSSYGLDYLKVYQTTGTDVTISNIQVVSAGVADSIIMIAASNSSLADKRRAAVVCSGVDDDLAIGRALNCLTLFNGGGSLYLAGGDYYVAGTMNILANKQNKQAIKIAGLNTAMSLNDKQASGAVIHMTQAKYESLSESDTFSVFTVQNGGDYNGKIVIENLTVKIPWNQKKVIAFNLSGSNGAIIVTGVQAYAYDNYTGTGGHEVTVFTPPPVAMEGSIGFKLCGNTPNGTYGNNYTNCSSSGFYENFAINGEHVVMISCCGFFGVYNWTFDHYFIGAEQHTNVFIKCADERGVNGPRFYNNGKQANVFIAFSLERKPANTPGGVLGPAATEQKPGQHHGKISYTLGYGNSVNNSVSEPFWEDGHGHGFKSDNEMHKYACTTSVRLAYKPNFLQRIWDTTLNKEVICIDESVPTWVDTMGNTV